MGSEASAAAGGRGQAAGQSGQAGFVGRLIAGRYRLAGLIGVGAMGAVWLARDELLDVDVAVKEIRPPFAPDPAAGAGGPAGTAAPVSEDADGWVRSSAVWVAQALREARNAARLRANPHVVTVHDAVVDGGAPWIIMEAVAARSLQEAVEDDGPRPLAEVARIGLAVLDALVAAQRLGVVHRDVKPSNILLAHDGRVLLTDFGIAASDADPTLTQPADGDLPSGTPAYMAPERLRGGPTTLTADLFALGATLLFAADGVAPFHRDSVVASLHAVLYAQPEPARDLGPLTPVIAGLLAKDPVARLRADGAAALLSRALRALDRSAALAILPSLPPSPPSPAPAALPPSPSDGPADSPPSPDGPGPVPAAGLPPAVAIPPSPVSQRPRRAARTSPRPQPGPVGSGRPGGTSQTAAQQVEGQTRPGGTSSPSRPRPTARPVARPAEASTATPVLLGQLDARATEFGSLGEPGGPDSLGDDAEIGGDGRDGRDGGGARWVGGGRSSPVPMPLGVVAVVVLLLAGVAAWAIGAAGGGGNHAPPLSSPSSISSPSSTSPAVLAPFGTGAAGAGTAGSGGTTAAGGAGAVPAAMLGRWHGTVTQGTDLTGIGLDGTIYTVPPARFEVTLDIRGGEADAAVGTSSTSEGCVADLLLREVGMREIQVQEVLTRSNVRCTGAYRLQLTLNDDGTLGYFYDATLIYSAGLATLTRM